MSLSSPQPTTLPLADIHLPTAPLWGLSLIGYGAIILFILLMMFIVWFIYRHRQKSTLKRLALAQLTQLKPHQTREISLLLKQAALSHFPREHVASLHGLAWWHFIEQQLPIAKQKEVPFSSRSEMLEQALYGQLPLSGNNQQQFYDDVHYWLSYALPIKKRENINTVKGKHHA